jgi:hypothetical protein
MAADPDEAVVQPSMLADAPVLAVVVAELEGCTGGIEL